jgi:gliding motility-associated-like protein
MHVSQKNIFQLDYTSPHTIPHYLSRLPGFQSKALVAALVLCLLIGSASAQKEAHNWYFGDHAGFTFNTDPPSALDDCAMYSWFGITSFSDKQGNLLFYANPFDIYNSNHQVMVNGHFDGYFGSTISSLAIPFHNDTTKYHLFNMSGSGSKSQKDNFGLFHSIVEPYYNNNQGRLVNKETFIYGDAFEKMAITRHANGKDWWILIHEHPGNNFHSFLIDENGVNSTPVTTSIGVDVDWDVAATRGYLRFSHDGNLVASAYTSAVNLVELFHFDNETGQLSNLISLSGFHHPFGIEFSPDNSKLYVGTAIYGMGGVADTLYQYDISNYNETSIMNSKVQIATSGPENFGSIQLGPDLKIYLSRQDFDFVSCIEFPNEIGLACNFIEEAIDLNGNASTKSLPVFTQSYLNPADFSFENACAGAEVQFTLTNEFNVESVFWDFGDGNTSSLTHPTHTYSSAGTYNVVLEVTATDGTIYTDNRNIEINPLPTVLFPNPPDVSVSQTAVVLTGGEPAGGEYSGDHVSDGLFNANAAGLGTHDIFYTYTNANNCNKTVTAQIQVIEETNATSGEANTWYFGEFSGLSFNTDPPTSLDNGALNTLEGCASISNSDGNILFYTDGLTVYNKLHTVMQNGNGLLGDRSSTQSAIICPYPGNTDLYFIFTVDANAGSNGLNYSLVDMTLDGGNGAIIAGQKNIRLSVGTIFTEKLTATRTADGTGFWVICHEFGNNNFQVYKIDADGLDINPQIIPVGTPHTGDPANSIGYLKVSPDGTRLACAISGPASIVELFDFDPASGNIDLVQSFDNGNSPYGIEFSPNSNFLYITSFQIGIGFISQLDIINNQISEVRFEPGPPYFGALQIGPDQKIYVARVNTLSLSTIESPDLLSPACDFQFESTPLINPVQSGLPTFIQSFFYEGGFTFENTCLGDITQFTLSNPTDVESVIWDFGDGGTSNEINPTHIYSSAADYVVELSVTLNDGSNFSFDEIVSITDGPLFTISAGTLVCEGEEMTLSVPTGFPQYTWSTGSNTNTTTVSSSDTYSCTVTDESGCQTTEEFILEMNPLPTVTLSNQADVCVNETAVPLSGGEPPGGSYSGNFVSGGSFNANAAGLGIHDIYYNYTDANGCSNADTAQITVNEVIEVTLNNFPDICQDADAIILSGGSPAGGSYSGTGVDGGSFDPSVAGPGTHTITYSYNIGACGGSESKEINVLPAPNVSFSLTDTDFCIDEAAFNLSGGSPTGGTYSGNGVSGGDFNPAVAGVGIHPITYSYTNTEGCSNQDDLSFTVRELPTVSLASFPELCENDAAYTLVEGNPTGGIYSGTGINDNEFDPGIGAGNYNITYTYQDGFGCENSDQNNLEVLPLPAAPASATASIYSYCENLAPATIELSVTGSETEYFWYENDFSGTAFSNLKTVVIPAPSSSVSYLVRGENSCGESAFLQIDIQVKPAPVAAFSFSGSPCQLTAINFTDNSVIADDVIDSWQWDFNDGTLSPLEAPQHTFNGYGIQTIDLIVSGSLGCSDTTSQTLEIHPKPIAAFSADTVCFGMASNLFNQSDGQGDLLTSFQWTADGQEFFSEDVSLVFSSHGFKDVQLIVESDNTCKDTITQEILVDSLPIAGFSYTNPCKSNVVTLTNLSDGNGKTIESWFWDFGNGQSSSQEELIYIYPDPGIYEISLLITDENGCENQITKNNIRVFPEFDVEIQASPFCIDIENTLQGTAIPEGITLDNWVWRIYDGSFATGQDLTQILPSSGFYTYQLIGNIDTCISGQELTIEVKELPTASFSYSGRCLQEELSFSDESSGDGLAVEQWNWNFDDGATATIPNPTHSYTTVGNYAATLQVTDANGCVNSFSQSINIRPLPVSQFNPLLPWCEGNTISFVNNSTTPGSFTGYLWNMGDGTTYSTEEVAHPFPTAGNQIVSLIVTDELNCKDTSEQVLFITPDFSLNIAAFNLCNNTTANLSGEVVDLPLSPDSWSWILPDGSTAAGQNTTYNFGGAGNFDVQLSVSKNGCLETHNQLLSVNPAPIASFIYSLVSLDDPVQFIDNSTLNGGPPIVAWSWNFGDPMSGLDNFSDLQNPVHLFSALGDYDVNLTVTDENGCSDDTTITLTVNPRPVAGFYWELPCFGTDVQFVDTSTTSQGFITDWFWNFGDPASGAFNESTAQNPTHSFTAPGIYNVQLVVKAFGYDTIVQQVEIFAPPTAEFSFNTPCQGEAVNFIDESLPGDAPIESWFWDFADGNTSDEQNPSHVYQFSGNYLVDLTVTDTNGCSATITKNVTIWQGPTAQFNTFSACVGNLTFFIDKSTADGADIIQWDWNFGDPASGGDNFSTEQNPSHEYTAEGVYEVILLVEDANGCVDSDTVDLVVEPAPVADFIADSVCLGNVMTFINQSFSTGQPISSYYWEFGDGTTSTDANPTKTYANPGNYDVLLVVETEGGCSAEVVKRVKVFFLPVADFEWTNNQACEMDTTFFTDFSAPVGNAIIDTWFWQFGDGGTSDERNPAHYYAEAGSYAVNLLVTDINGCQNSITKTVVVSEAPVSNFIFNTTDCNTLNFTSTGFDPNGLDITAWYWDFGDPASGGDNTSINANPSHTYVNGGTYNVLHIVFNENGCRDTIVQQVLISGPEAAFSFENNCSGLPVNFFDESNTNANDPAVAWLWDFNDGSPNSIQQNPTHVFDLGGSYLVSLTITTVNGCVSQTAELVEVEFGPTANFTFTSLSCSGDSIQFTDASTGDAGIDTWNWQMGDGTQFDIPNPKHAYAVAGTYLVKLRVTDANGCYNDKSVSLEIDQSPTANFNWETRNCDTTFFSDFSNPNGTTINAWTWQFDDPASGAENISFLQNPFHKFTATGAYNVQLTVSNTFLCSDTLTRLVEYQAQPEPDFTFDTVCFGQATSFSDLTPTDFQDIQAWIWDFGDNSALSFEQNPEHVYNAPGTYFAKLKVINGTFCEDSIVKQVLVRELPIVDFSPDSSCFTQPVTFIDESTANGDNISSWLWDFGDGSSGSDLQSPTHTFADPDIYQVSLTVVNNFSCANTRTKAHYVNDLPFVDFEYQAACAGSVTQFTSLASSAVGIDSWQWDFGDGSSGSNAANPNHTFSLPGLYPVKLIVTDFLGCVDSITKVVEAFEIPTVAFDAPAVCLGDSMFFTDLTLPQADSWSWSFGDGGTSTDQNPKHLYQNAGTYSVLLQASTPGGCSSSVVQQVEVYPLPIVDFAWNFAACAGSEVQFEDLSQGISGDVTEWEWDFGDGSPVSNDQNPVHIFQTGDVAYNVQLVVVTETGCTDTLVQEVGITGAPLAEFSISNGAGEGPCVNNTFSFEDLSTTQSGIIQDWEWDFGDGNGSGSKDPLHNYDEADTYTVRLIVTNTAGCVDTATQELDVFALPIVEFSFDSVCFGDTTQFIDSDFINVGAIDLWQYNFGDGSPPSDESDPKHLFTGPGDYTVILQLTDTNLCVNQKDSIVPVYGLPLVNFTFDTACLFEATNFSDLSIPADHDLDQWTWNFGDGNSVTGISDPSHTYDDFGNYTTKLIVTDSWGCVDSTQKLVNVYEPPIAQFSWSDTSCTAGKIYFFDESFHNQGWAITQRLWDINNFESDLAEPVYIFPDVETTYPVSLIATDQRGCSDTLTEDVFVPAELSIDFTADTVCFGDSTMLIASALLPANAQVGTWIWFFDDGSPQLSTTEDTVYHSFASDGVFRVELTALELATNCNATIRKDVLVRKLPTAAFLAAAAACADSTEFIDQSALGDGPISNWTWYFGDGNSESITAPDPADTKYLYPPFLDTFEASLAITDVFGCEDSIAQEVFRFPCLFVNFTTDTNIYCQDKAVTLIDSSIVQSNAVVLQKYWNFGDGTELITDPDIDTVTHIYEQTGIYEIAFAIRFEINGDILSDTIRKSIEVYPTPIVAIAAENVCDGEEALLVSNTDANNSIVDNWTWFFGDGEQINIISDDVNNAVYHTYPQSGSYDLMLMAVTDLGCRDTASKAFVVNPVPQVVITADTTEICGPGTILFTDASTLESGSIIRRGWSFGDFTDAIVTEDTISHFYDMGSTSSSGSRYTVTLTAVSDSSCSATDSIVNMISQYSLPRPAFTVEPDSIAITEVEELMLFNDSENAFYFDWVLSDTLRYEDSYEPNIWQDIQDTGTYNLQLLAQTVDGCWDSTESQFKVYPIFRFFIPNAFSPNGNGVNETFGPKGRYFDDKTFKMQIFSRWGELVFETEDFFEQWDGRNKNGGKMQPIGVYAWVIEVVDLQGNIKTFKGAVTLVL